MRQDIRILALSSLLVLGSSMVRAEEPGNLEIGGPGPHYVRRGKLGVGKTDPRAAVDVAGDALVSGKLHASRVSVGSEPIAQSEQLDVRGNVRMGSAPSQPAIQTANLSVSDTVIQVNSTAGYPSSGTLALAAFGEVVTYSGKTATSFTGLKRGALGTTPHSLSAGLPVYPFLVIVRASDSEPKLVVRGDGFIGIGTAYPRAPVDIYSQAVYIRDDSDDEPFLHIQDQDGSSADILDLHLAASRFRDRSFIQSSGGLSFATNVPGQFIGATRLRIERNGQVAVGTSLGEAALSPGSLLEVGNEGYLHFRRAQFGAPPATDCNEDVERGRLTIDTASNRLYICNGQNRGWDYVPLTN